MVGDVGEQVLEGLRRFAWWATPEKPLLLNPALYQPLAALAGQNEEAAAWLKRVAEVKPIPRN